MAFQAPTTSWLQTTYQRFITVFKAPVCSLEMLEESCDHDITMADSWGGAIGGASSWQGCWKKIQAVAQLNPVFSWGVCVLWVLGAYTLQEAYGHSLPLPTPLRKCDNPTKLEFSSSLNLSIYLSLLRIHMDTVYANTSAWSYKQWYIKCVYIYIYVIYMCVCACIYIYICQFL